MKSSVWNSLVEQPLRRPTGTALALLAVLAIAGHGPALAASEPGSESRVIADKFVINLGGYLIDFKTTAAVGSGSLIGTVIRLEDQLGLDDNKSLFRSDGIYRFNSRHALGFGFWSLNRDGQANLSGTIEFDGNTFEAGVNIQTAFDVQWIRADWRYSFLRTDRGEAGFSVGLSTYDFEVALEGDATVDDGMGGVMVTRVRAEETIFAPVPTFGMFVNYALTPNVLFKSTINFLDLEAGDFEGEVSDIMFVFEWYLSEHVGIGGGTSRTNIEYKDTGDNPLNIDYTQSGFLAYVTFAFGDVN